MTRPWSTLPNALALMRIALVVPIWLALSVPVQLGYATALLLFAIAAFTDLIDGWIARALGVETALGATLDAIADKILVICMLAGLAVYHRLDAVALAAFALIALREAFITLMRLGSLRRGDAIQANLVAKAKTACQMMGVAALLTAPFEPRLNGLGGWLLAVGATFGFVSAGQYLLGERAPSPLSGERAP